MCSWNIQLNVVFKQEEATRDEMTCCISSSIAQFFREKYVTDAHNDWERDYIINSSIMLIFSLIIILVTIREVRENMRLKISNGLLRW